MSLAVVCPCGALRQPGQPCQRCSGGGGGPRTDAARQKAEPWRRVYTLAAWKKRCRPHVLDRDGHRCVVVDHGERCTGTTRLHVHHHPRSLEEIWQEAQREGWDWSTFEAEATDPDHAITTCARHNNALDALRRKART